MNDLVKQSFSLNLTTLRYIGLYPPKKPSKFYLLYGYVLLFFALLPDPILGSLYYFRAEGLSLFDAGPNLFLMIAMLSFVPKMLPFIISNKQIRDCFTHLDRSFKTKLNKKQEAITNDCIWICQRNSRFFFFCIVLDNIAWASTPLFSSQLEFPLEVWLPFDPTTNWVIYSCVYVFVEMGVTYTGLSNAAVDTLISGLAYHAAGQMKILKDNLEFLFEYAETSDNKTQSEVIYQRIRECSQHHQHIISFVKKIENCFSWVVLSQFMGGTLMICLCCLQLTEVEPGSVDFFLPAAFLCSALIQVYLHCYYGTTLYEESNTLATAAYLGRWYEYDLKSQKALILFMERAKIPMTLTAGKLFDLSLNTFTNILKKSYSLLAVLENY